MGEPGTPPSLHRYLYAYANPTVYIDLTGYNNELASDSNQKKTRAELDAERKERLAQLNQDDPIQSFSDLNEFVEKGEVVGSRQVAEAKKKQRQAKDALTAESKNNRGHRLTKEKAFDMTRKALDRFIEREIGLDEEKIQDIKDKYEDGEYVAIGVIAVTTAVQNKSEKLTGKKKKSKEKSSNKAIELSIRKPSVFNDPNLTQEERELAEKAWKLKKQALTRAAKKGELVWSPGTEDRRIAKLQKEFREAVAERFKKMFNKDLDMSKLNADHPVDMIVGGDADQRFKLISDRVNKSVGASLKAVGRREKLKSGDKISRIKFIE